jgi:hypothetical protein
MFKFKHDVLSPSREEYIANKEQQLTEMEEKINEILDHCNLRSEIDHAHQRMVRRALLRLQLEP